MSGHSDTQITPVAALLAVAQARRALRISAPLAGFPLRPARLLRAAGGVRDDGFDPPWRDNRPFAAPSRDAAPGAAPARAWAGPPASGPRDAALAAPSSAATAEAATNQARAAATPGLSGAGLAGDGGLAAIAPGLALLRRRPGARGGRGLAETLPALAFARGVDQARLARAAAATPRADPQADPQARPGTEPPESGAPDSFAPESFAPKSVALKSGALKSGASESGASESAAPAFPAPARPAQAPAVVWPFAARLSPNPDSRASAIHWPAADPARARRGADAADPAGGPFPLPRRGAIPAGRMREADKSAWPPSDWPVSAWPPSAPPLPEPPPARRPSDPLLLAPRRAGPVLKEIAGFVAELRAEVEGELREVRRSVARIAERRAPEPPATADGVDAIARRVLARIDALRREDRFRAGLLR